MSHTFALWRKLLYTCIEVLCATKQSLDHRHQAAVLFLLCTNCVGEIVENLATFCFHIFRIFQNFLTKISKWWIYFWACRMVNCAMAMYNTCSKDKAQMSILFVMLLHKVSVTDWIMTHLCLQCAYNKMHDIKILNSLIDVLGPKVPHERKCERPSYHHFMIFENLWLHPIYGTWYLERTHTELIFENVSLQP